MLAAMQALEQQGAKMIMLATRIDNLRAQGLYQQLGFTTASTTGSFIFMERYLA
jgi:ribosomal protein S18 acetylase RimI-like enzyme